ncbi:MAG: SufS family cysteine desulfurase [Oscillospiraceae bacterium]|nr:SufS family cysteine desulfurase [Oscillospiraceae bacterium]
MDKTFSVTEIRKDFPILNTKRHGYPLVYLDNAATLQMPVPVQERIRSHYDRDNANVHRGVHALSQASTNAMETARETVARFIGADTDEIIFTAGTTDSINMLARMLEDRIRPGQQILVSAMEHHSNLIPWQEMSRRTGADLEIIPLDSQGDLNLEALEQLLQRDTFLVAAAWVSNVTGAVNPVDKITALAHAAGALTVIDGAQGMKLGVTDVTALDCDFLAFSGHKLGALTGIGVLYGKRSLLKALAPVRFGGGMVGHTDYRSSTWGMPPQCFEAGTPHYVGAISLGAALEYLTALGPESIARWEEQLTTALVQSLSLIPGITVLGTPRRRTGAVSFYAESIHPFDLGVMLDTLGIAVRTGHMCAQPLVESFGVHHVLRASPAFYNTMEEINRLEDALKRINPVLRGAAEMMTLAEKQELMIQNINALGDCFDQYSYLIVKAQQLTPLPEEMKTPAALVPGCQSQVWLYTRTENGRLFILADSDTLILRGVLQILRELFDGENVTEISALPVRLFQETELAATFTSDRNTGVQTILRKIRNAPE